MFGLVLALGLGFLFVYFESLQNWDCLKTTLTQSATDNFFFFFKDLLGRLGGSGVEHLPLAQLMILGSWNQVPCQAPCREPASPSACVSASLSVCLS